MPSDFNVRARGGANLRRFKVGNSTRSRSEPILDLKVGAAIMSGVAVILMLPVCLVLGFGLGVVFTLVLLP